MSILFSHPGKTINKNLRKGILSLMFYMMIYSFEPVSLPQCQYLVGKLFNIEIEQLN